MSEPPRASDRTETAGADSSGDLEPTRAGPAGFVPPSVQGDSGPHFGPPTQAGELGTFGRYRVLKKLGQGGMGAVYLGYDGTLGRKVALKMMLPAHAADPESRDRFVREARLAAAITSDHVVTIFDVGVERAAAGSAGRTASSDERAAAGSAGRTASSDERGFPFIAMEYLQGFPLDQFLRTKGELPLPHVLRIGCEVAWGLAAAHDLGLIHRDIKPANVWLEHPRGRVKILDFGLARAQNDDTQLTGTGLVVGTPAFMSPEQARGLKLDGRSDLFSLGIMLYRLCTGKMPFDGPTTMAVLTALAVDTPPPPRQLNPQLPAAVAAVLMKLLAKNPAGRFQTAAEVADALLAAGRSPSAAELPVVVVPLSVGAQPQNVWENIDASQSAAVPLPSGDSSAALSEAVPAPRARRSKLPLVLAGSAVGLAVAAVVAVVAWPAKKPEAAQVEPPKPVPAPAERNVVPPKATDPQRKAAEFALSRHADVRAIADGKEVIALKPSELPPPGGTFELTGLELFGREWTDADMGAFRDLPAITRLKLHDTNVSEPGLKVLRGYTRLEELGLEVTHMSDVGVGYFGGNVGLRSLSLSGTRITDYGTSFFVGCKKLTHLVLSGTQVTDVTLERFAACPTVRNVEVAGTAVTDAGLAHLARWPDLKFLDLSGTAVTDAGLTHLAHIGTLERVTLTGTKVTPTGVMTLRKALPKCEVQFEPPK